MLRRVKYLTLMQIGDQLRGIKVGGKKKLATTIAIKTLFAVLAIAIFYAVFMVLKNFFSFAPTRNMLVTLVFITQVVSIVSCLSSMILVLFLSKENTMLLAFPCRYSEIFSSKIIVFALEEVKKSLYFLLPMLIGFGANASVGVGYWLQLPIVWITLCLLPVFIAATLSILAIYIKRFLQTHVFIYAVLMVVLITAGFFGAYTFLTMIPIPVDIGGQYNEFVISINQVFADISSVSLFYNFIGDAVFGNMVYLYLPLTILTLCGFGALCFFAAMPFYFRAASSTAENSSKKKHHLKYSKHGGLFMTFFKKELKIHFRSFESMTSIIIVVFLFPVISFIFNFIMSVINTSSLGNIMTIAFNLMITLSLLGTHNANTAAALSMEGNEFAILKTAPSNTSIIAWAKIAVTAIINLMSVIVTAGMLMFMKQYIGLRIEMQDVILMSACILFISIGQAAWSFEFDLRKPKISDYAAKGDAVTDNGNIAKALGISFLVATLVGFLSILLLLDAYMYGWVRLVGLAFGLLVARLYLFNSNLKSYFQDIQG